MKLLYTLVLLAFFITRTFGQTVAKVEGIVLEENGEPVENAIVNFLNTSFTTSTDSRGKFFFPELPYGTYVMTIQKGGRRLLKISY